MALPRRAAGRRPISPRRPNLANVALGATACLIASAGATMLPANFDGVVRAPDGKLMKDEMPLRTKGRWVVGKSGERVKLACVNWYGAHSGTYVVGGLEMQPLGEIVAKIVELGFNCVRLPYSTEAQWHNPIVKAEFVQRNPEFAGLRFQDVFDKVVEAMTEKGLLVFPNNQNHKAGWCCYYKQDEGLWYVPGYSAQVWVDSLVNMTRRYKNNPLVAGIDLRNEVHDYDGTVLTWGTGSNYTDWAAAATGAGNAVLAVNPDMLIIVNGICFGMEIRPARHHPIRLSVPNRVVYEAHNYLEFNFLNTFSEVVTAWYNVRLATALVFVFCSASCLMFYLTWRVLGHPKPPSRAIVATCGFWFFGYSLVAIAIAQACNMALRRLPGCGYWADRDVIPVIFVWVALAFVSISVALTGVCLKRLLRCRRSCPGLWPQQRAARDQTSDGTTSREIATNEEGRMQATSSADERMYAPGCASCKFAAAQWKALLRSSRVGKTRVAHDVEDLRFDLPPAATWDCGLCCGLQCSIFCCTMVAAMLAVFILAAVAPSYWAMAYHLDKSWGFLLEEGYEYTAPVWMGEFGSDAPGHYWNNLVQYMNDRDMDFAYWALNGRKWTTGFIDTMDGGKWVDTAPHWSDEEFGVLDTDYRTVRYPWMMEDLRALQEVPARWRPMRPYCDRRVMGPSCGG